MSSLPRRAVIEHDARLDILCCLKDGPLSVIQVSDRARQDPRITEHHIEILGTFGVVRKKDGGNGQLLYVARLDEQPDWVREAVEAHRGTLAK